MKKILYLTLAFAAIASLFVPAFGLATAGASLCSLPFMAGRHQMSVQEMSDFAGKNFSSFEGDYFEGDEFYGFGGDDHSLDFGGNASSFIDEASSERIFTMIITNASADTNLEAYILPGLEYAPGMVGAPKTGAFKSVSNADGLTGSGSPKSLELFYAFIMKNPTNVGKLVIKTSSKTAQLDQIILVEEETPFASAGGRPININVGQNEQVYRDKVATVPTPWLIASDQVKAKMLFLFGETVSITWHMGVVKNASAALAKDVKKAQTGLGMIASNGAVAGIGIRRASKALRLGRSVRHVG